MNKQVALAMLLMTWSYTVLFAQSDCVRFRKGGVYETTVGDSYHVATADLNGDSNVDFVVPGTFGFVAVFTAMALGTFPVQLVFLPVTIPLTLR